MTCTRRTIPGRRVFILFLPRAHRACNGQRTRIVTANPDSYFIAGRPTERRSCSLGPPQHAEHFRYFAGWRSGDCADLAQGVSDDPAFGRWASGFISLRPRRRYADLAHAARRQRPSSDLRREAQLDGASLADGKSILILSYDKDVTGMRPTRT